MFANFTPDSGKLNLESSDPLDGLEVRLKFLLSEAWDLEVA